MLELHYGPGACSFVPHVALEAIKGATGEDFVARPVKLHKGEQRSAEYLAINPNAQVPTLVVDGKPLSQIVAICSYIAKVSALRACGRLKVRWAMPLSIV